jgi:hypothetical protein
MHLDLVLCIGMIMPLFYPLSMYSYTSSLTALLCVNIFYYCVLTLGD